MGSVIPIASFKTHRTRAGLGPRAAAAPAAASGNCPTTAAAAVGQRSGCAAGLEPSYTWSYGAPINGLINGGPGVILFPQNVINSNWIWEKEPFSGK